jgi:outer membrane protein assembly factor BamE
MSTITTRISTLVVLAMAIFSLSACIKPYQPDIQQGNILNNSDLREIRYGMSKQEVLFILGTPMVIDPFNESRWDYFFSKRDQRKKETAKRLVTAIFDGDTLIELRGDVDLSKVQSLEPSVEDMQHGGTVITKPTRKEKGFFSRFLRNRKDLKAKRAVEKAEEKKLKAAAKSAESES